MRKIILSLIITITLFSCRTAKVLKYYESIDTIRSVKTKEEIDALLRINAFVLDPTAGSSASITDLSDRGQASLVDALNTKTTSSQELLSALAMPIEEEASTGGVKGSTIWRKRVVINLLKIDKERANRVQQILFTLQIPAVLRDKVEFISWDKIATETQVIDLGKIAAGSSTTLSLSPEIAMSGTLQGTTSGGISNTSTFSEEKSFTAKLAGLNAAIVNGNTFQVFRQALPNEDITGNIVVELTLRSEHVKEFTIYKFGGLYNNGNVVSDQSQISISRTIWVRPDFGTYLTVPIDLTYDFRYRKVGKGNQTEPEYDDHVSYLDGETTDTGKFLLFDKKASEKIKTWEITDGTNYLNISRPGTLEQPIFSSSASANELLNWIKKTKSLSVSDYQLNLGLKAMTIADIQKLQVVPAK